MLRSELADAGRPVREGSTDARSVRRSAARTEQIVAGSTREEGSAPVGVVARVRDVLARDPDRVAVDRGRAVVAPPRARWVPDLCLVAREAVVGRGTGGDDLH